MVQSHREIHDKFRRSRETWYFLCIQIPHINLAQCPRMIAHSEISVIGDTTGHLFQIQSAHAVAHAERSSTFSIPEGNRNIRKWYHAFTIADGRLISNQSGPLLLERVDRMEQVCSIYVRTTTHINGGWPFELDAPHSRSRLAMKVSARDHTNGCISLAGIAWFRPVIHLCAMWKNEKKRFFWVMGFRCCLGPARI